MQADVLDATTDSQYGKDESDEKQSGILFHEQHQQHESTPSNPMRTLTNSGKRKPVRSIQRVAIGVMTMASSDKASMTVPAIPDVVPMKLCKNGWKLSETAKKITLKGYIDQKSR